MAKTKKKDEEAKVDVDIYASIEKELNRQFGMGTVINLDVIDKSIDRVSTENLELDEILGGGWPKGHIAEIYGLNGVGKTTTVAETAKVFQANDERPILVIDSDNKLNLDYIEQLGVDLSSNRFKFSQASAIEEITEICKLYIKAGVSAIFIDAISVLFTKREEEQKIDPDTGAYKQDTGHKAQVLTRFWRQIAPLAKKHNTFIMATNHIKKNTSGYGAAEFTPGGESTKNHAIIRIEMKKLSKNDGGEIIIGGEQVGQKVKFFCVKNQAGKPYKSRDINIMFGVGFDNDMSLINMAVFFDIIKSGAAGWYTLPNEEKVQGSDKLRARIVNDPELYMEIKNSVKKELGN